MPMTARKAMATIGVGMLTLLTAVWAPGAGAAPAVDGHFTIPGGFDANSKIAMGPDGNMWMTVKDVANDVARIGPGGEVTEFELPGVVSASGIAAGPDGKLWVTQIGGVASFSPSDPKNTGKATLIAGINGNASIVAGPDEQMWVATDEQVFHFPPAKPEDAKAFSVPKLSPKDIDVAGSLLAIADFGNERVVTLTTSGTVGEIPLLGGTTSAQGVAGSPDGLVAFSKSDNPEGLGLAAPPAFSPTAVEMPGDPFGVARGSDGAFWFAMSAADNLERLTPDGKATPLAGFPEKFFPRQIAAGPNNTLWVTMEIPGENVYEVAKVSGLEPPVEPEEAKQQPQTRLRGPKGKVRTKGRKARLRFRFSSPTAGATFECALVKLRKHGKQPKPRFKACKSPRKLKLKPGRYRFSVRAIAAGVADPTPASHSFRVVRVKRRR
jgi:streptogramin lyase